MLGMFLLLEIAVHVTHMQNIVSFSYLKKHAQGITGRIIYTSHFSYSNAFFHGLIWAVVFALCFLFSGIWFFLGGVLSCLLSALRFWRIARKAGNATVPPEQHPEAVAEQP